MSEDNGSDKEVDKPKKTVPQNLTPVTIMVVNIISSVWSRNLLKMLLDSGSATIMIHKNAYLGTISHVRSSAAGKNTNQQKAFIFQSDTCKYYVILFADFLTKTGLVVKYSTVTIERFDNKL